MALRVLPRLLYGAGHAYGNPLTGSGTTESISKMTREDLVKLHDTWYHPNNATLVIVGDTTLAEIRPKLEKLFANWKPEQVPKKNVSTVSLPQKSAVYLIDKPGAQQSVIIAGIVDRKSTRLNSSHGYISYAVFCLKKKHNKSTPLRPSHAPLRIASSDLRISPVTLPGSTTYPWCRGTSVRMLVALRCSI